MRGGSTLTGTVLGHRLDTFYLYEPLYKISRRTYWHGHSMVCRSDRLECRHVEPWKAIPDKSFVDNLNRHPTGSLELAKNILSKTYDCQFNGYERTVVEPSLTPTLGGPSWNTTRECMKPKVNYQICFQGHIPRRCKDSTHKVTKVLRLTTDLLAPVLQSRENLKVIHLFRDPRAIVNSRITSWYPSYTDKMIIENAKSLCNKMLYDFREGQKVQKLFPDRFRFIYYEDLNVVILNKSKLLYNYLGMNINEKYYPNIMKLSAFKDAGSGAMERKRNTAFWWRNSLKWEIVEKMEEICKDVYKEVGYKSFHNKQEYDDLSIPSVVIPKEYLII
ncbi:carbohydrate sulfotransferase 1-like [Ruditapes philippinarum]|uniref:carbohydrate sulfotransferase 1-like n=1 Tax=Ruditapes philippinarum TaxID=129788 RepID=UPI00295A8CF0|nr:carbohydrate sulfotransferase 1-like [Ruditapes philippinarum]